MYEVSQREVNQLVAKCGLASAFISSSIVDDPKLSSTLAGLARAMHFTTIATNATAYLEQHT